MEKGTGFWYLQDVEKGTCLGHPVVSEGVAEVGDPPQALDEEDGEADLHAVHDHLYGVSHRGHGPTVP